MDYIELMEELFKAVASGDEYRVKDVLDDFQKMINNGVQITEIEREIALDSAYELEMGIFEDMEDEYDGGEL